MANKPSVKTLATIFGDAAKEARKVLEMTYSQATAHPVGAKRYNECFHPPGLVDVQMHILNDLGDFHGLESVQIGDDYVEYLNAGEMYTPTLIYFQGRYRVQDLGTFLERNDRGQDE